MREDLIRGAFSFLAAAVLLAMSSEWTAWAFEEHRPWKLIPAAILAGFAVFESRQVWERAEAVLFGSATSTVF